MDFNFHFSIDIERIDHPRWINRIYRNNRLDITIDFYRSQVES